LVPRRRLVGRRNPVRGRLRNGFQKGTGPLQSQVQSPFGNRFARSKACAGVPLGELALGAPFLCVRGETHPHAQKPNTLPKKPTPRGKKPNTRAKKPQTRAKKQQSVQRNPKSVQRNSNPCKETPNPCKETAIRAKKQQSVQRNSNPCKETPART